MKKSRLLGARLIIALALCVFVGSAHAATVIYDYQGKNFTGSAIGAPPGLTAISGFIEIPMEISPNLTGEFITPISFSFTDGVTTLTNLTPGYSSSFQFTTTSTGGIFDWRIFISNYDFPEGKPHTMEIRTQHASQFEDSHWASPVDEVNYCTEVVSGSCLNNADIKVWAPGAWFLNDVQVSPIPLPPALWLFGTGLLGLIGMARKKAAK